MSDWKKTWQEFLDRWTIKNIEKMTLDEYTNLDRSDSFTYWLERKTENVLGIGGGSSYKFGVFRRDQSNTGSDLKSSQSGDEEYGWYLKYGNNREDVFKKVKDVVLQIAKAASEKKFEEIDNIDFSPAVKWKIAFLYAPEGTLLRIASKNAFENLASLYKINTKKISEIQSKLIGMKDLNKDFFDYSSELWEKTQLDKNEAEEDDEETAGESSDKKMGQVMHNQVRNQILYGPPGTGKTYNTINKALEIIDGKVPEKRDDAKKRFDELKNAGQIVFTTFHQSYGYEEFVEGIKAIPPKTDTNNTDQMIYSTVDGILKSLVKDALSKGTIESKNNKEVINDKTIIWKMSLGDSQSGEDIEYFEEAIRTESIIMGYGGDIDFSECSKKEDIATKTADKTTIDMIDRFKFQMKQDDIVIISDGNRKFKAIARVDGDYSFDGGSDFKQKRKIQWLQKFTSSRDVKDISDRYFTQVTLNRPQGINREKLKNILSDYTKIDNTLKSYVLIIDEINRGNISKIFGELITLIEESKRIGKPEEIRVSLPYSGMEFDGGKGFGVPQNVYIIGTMNTADRSIALMDTALRRRFHFEEMMPDYKVLKELKVGDIEIAKMLQKINERIEYLYDRDHQIGHAYFMSLKGKDGDDATAELDNIFRNKIIPLLQEYFYDDWEKIQMVLGDHPGQKAEDGDKFIKSTPSEEKVIFGFDHHDIEDEKVKYEINKIFSLKAYEKIYS